MWLTTQSGRALARSILLTTTIGLRPRAKRFARDEARLRHRTLDGVDQDQDAIHHRQRTLHLSAEIAVARGVHDVDVHARVVQSRVLREDRDASLALEVVAVHHALLQMLMGREHAGLTQQLVDQGGLSVVDVSDDGEIANGSVHGRAKAVEKSPVF